MANQPFDQTIINALERPTSSDLNQAQGQAHADVRLLASKLFQAVGATAGQEGFVGDSFKVVPTSPASMNVQITNGIGFQNGSTEANIGGIAGLTDAYPYKALTISDRLVAVPSYIALPFVFRYDLIQVRAPTGTERLANSQSKDIYNPTLNSFNATTVYKTLSSDLTSAPVEYIDYNETGTGLIVYKTGLTYTGSAVYPSVDPGYLPLAYIFRETGQTSIDFISATVPRAVLGATPNYGYAIKTGSSSITSSSWTSVSSLSINTISLRDGLARIRIQPQSGGLTGAVVATNYYGALGSNPVYVKVTVAGPITREFVFSCSIPHSATDAVSIPLPSIEDYFSSGQYAISVSAKCEYATDMSITFTNLVLFVAQG